MFDFLGGSLLGSYESRKVDRYEEGDLAVSTVAVTDVEGYNYETAIFHPAYRKDDWIIVEQYITKDEAQEGHNKWVKTMTAKTLPAKLKDVSTCFFASLAKSVSDKKDWEYQFKERREESR